MGKCTTPRCPGHRNHEFLHNEHRTRRSDGPNAGSLGPFNRGRFLAYTACSVTTLDASASMSSADKMPRLNPTIRGMTSDRKIEPVSENTADEDGTWCRGTGFSTAVVAMDGWYSLTLSLSLI